MRRDLEIDCDPASLVLAPPDRSELKEMFRRFEFRNLLRRVDELEAALPSAEPRVEGLSVPWAEREIGRLTSRVGIAVAEGRVAVAADGEPVAVGPFRVEDLRDAEILAHDFKALPHELLRAGVAPAEDTLLAAYLIEPGRASYLLDDLAAEYGIELTPEPPAEEDTASLVRGAGAVLHLAGPMRARVEELELEGLYRDVEIPLTSVLAAMEDAGVRIDTYRMGEITARLADRVEELEASAQELAGEEFVVGSTQQVARILFEKLGLEPGRKGKTGYSTDTRVLRSLRDVHPIVPVIEEWREYSKLLNTYLGPLPELISPEDGRLHTTFNQTVAATGRLSTSNPNLQSIPIRTELGRTIRSAFVADQGWKLLSADYSQVELRILAHICGEPKLREAFLRGDDIHAATAAEVLGKDQATLTKDERNRAKAVNFGIIYGISAFGLSDQLEIPREEAAVYIDTYLARFPNVQGSSARRSSRRSATGRYERSSAGAGRSRSCASRTVRRDRSASGSPSTRSCRAPRRTSSRSRWSPSIAGCAQRVVPPGSSSRCTTSCCSRFLRPRSRPCATSSARRCAARTSSIRRSSSTSAPATTGPRRRRKASRQARRTAAAPKAPGRDASSSP